MKKISLVSTDNEKLEKLLAPFAEEFSVVTEHPECVIAFGGDGTLMRAEHQRPGVPKLFLRNSKVAKLAHEHSNEYVLKSFFGGAYDIKELLKLRIETPSGTAEALNDAIIHNADPRHAIRYSVSIDGRKIHEEVIGDGVVCATSLGATGYYRSVTDSIFESGIGLAFNNSTEQTDHIVVSEHATLSFIITRGPAFCYADNQEAFFTLSEGDAVTIQKSKNTAKILRVKDEKGLS